jgi:DNA helicase-2/ATP-dependent DNA helicase PcrA
MAEIQELPKDIKELDLPFKISAGPGAGKTTWLVRHVQNVIKNSDRLGKTKKVACITYTRIGADTVNKKVKVETGTNRLDIGTIHSFLYRNVIKPFSFLIEKDQEDNVLFNTKKFSGIIENRLNHGRFSSWKKDRVDERKFYLFDEKLSDDSGNVNLEKTKDCLNSIDWKFSNEEVAIGLTKKYWPKLKIKIGGNVEGRTVSKVDLLKYKKKYWTHGMMHHEDVLYFTHYIFKNYPRTIELVSNKFPYLFLDEFQDTNPLQTWIVKQLTTKSTVIGVIGDPAQSIFEFAGAQRKDFNDFVLPDLIIYKKSDNFRSTIKIIEFLKTLRDDIEQEPSDEAEEGGNVVILVGEASNSIKYVKELEDDNYAVLCRYNKDINRLKYNTKNIQGDNLISALYSEDSNNQRPRFIHSLLKAYDFFEHEEYKEAIKEINKHLRTAKVDGFEKRKLSIKIIEYLQENGKSQIIDIYSYLKDELGKHQVKLTGIGKTKGNYKGIYLNKFEDFLPFLSKQTKLTSQIRTIHQAKGDEFNNVLLCLFDKTDKNGKISKYLKNILDDYIFNAKENINLDSTIGEETRLVYVACSRARNRLFISVPELSKEDEIKMNKLGIEVERN